MSQAEPKSQYKVQVLSRSISILDILAASDQDLSLNELSERLRLHKSTVHRLANVLEQHRLVDKNPQSGRYRLGLKLFELGNRAVAGLDIRERARPFLERLAFDANETVHLCVLDEREVLYVDKVEPSRSVRMASSVGRRNPAHCTGVGKAMMACLDEAEVDEIIQRQGLRAFTKHTITSPVALKHELREICQRGYALDREENEEGVNCIAAPVRNYSGRVIAAISLSGPAFRINEKNLQVMITAVVNTASALSEALGYNRTNRATAGSTN
jgi:IclR family transcriptional regulator, KDG regulon repressor